MQTDITQWKEKEKVRINELREKNIREQGGIPYLQLKEGENPITLLPVLPKVEDGNFGPQVIFQIKAFEKEYLLSTREGGTLHKELVDAISNEPVNVTIERWGTGKDTRYKIKK